MSESTSTRAKELMLVEDNFGDAMLAEEAFGAMKGPVNLSIVGDGEDALNRLRRTPPYEDWPRPDLVLLDLNLPRMNGQAVLQAIRADPALRTLPVIVMTGSNSAADINDSYAMGANGYIVKPMHFEALEEIAAAIEQFWFRVAALPSAQATDRSHAA